MTFAGGPQATSLPPLSPPSSPRSAMQSASRMMSRLSCYAEFGIADLDLRSPAGGEVALESNGNLDPDDGVAVVHRSYEVSTMLMA
jgi:hypothetical protein